jgi:integrase
MKLNEQVIKTLSVPPAGNKVHYFTGAVIQGAKVPHGFGVRVTAGGARSFVMNYRTGSVERRFTIGRYPDWSVLMAVKRARELRQRIDRGEDPLDDRRKQDAVVANTFKTVAEDYLKRECGMKRDANGSATFEGGNIRSGDQRLKVFERLVYPTLGSRPIGDIKRSDVVRLLDKVQDASGPRMAHVTLAYISKLMNWHATRHDDFQSPIVRGMGRVKPRERAGKRVLTDDEIRDVWAALDVSDVKDMPSCFARLLRTLFLTATRRTESAAMSWPEIDGEVWTVPGSRMKGKLDHAVPLTPDVAAIIGERPKDAKSRPFVFSTTDGVRPFSGYSKAKSALDKEIAKLRKSSNREPMPSWTLSRDIRRTAKTLMARAGVRPDISERVLAHVIPGVEGVYDRYDYLDEKREALDRLATLIMQIAKQRSSTNP